jgi:hypothetical protein
MRDRKFTMTPRPLYFVNWWFDGLIMGGLSIITFLALTLFYDSKNSGPILGFALVLNLFVNYPHFSATIYRLYQDPDNIRQFPVTAWGVPLVLLGAVLACFWQLDVIAPYFLMLFVLWSPYHYSGQAIGLTMVYARRSGFPIGRRERLALSAFVFSAFVCGMIRMQQSGSNDFYGMHIPVFPVTPWMYAGAQAAMWTGALVFAGFALVWCIQHKRLLPPIVLLPAVTHFVWYVPGASVESFLIVVPLFHSLQYLLIALFMQLKLRIDVEGREHSWRRIRAEALRWGIRNVFGGVMLFIGLPVLFSWLPFPIFTTAGILVAAVNIHHFFVDGVIWKLRNAATASALQTNLAELSGPRVGRTGPRTAEA